MPTAEPAGASFPFDERFNNKDEANLDPFQAIRFKIPCGSRRLECAGFGEH